MKPSNLYSPSQAQNYHHTHPLLLLQRALIMLKVPRWLKSYS